MHKLIRTEINRTTDRIPVHLLKMPIRISNESTETKSKPPRPSLAIPEESLNI